MPKKIDPSGYLFLFLSLLIPLVYYLNRFLLPDYAFDTVNYHIFIGERGLHNFLFPFGKGEFFPTGLHTFSPLFEVLGAFVRRFLGYRLGTLPTLMSYFIIIFYVYRFIRLLIPEFFKKKPAILPFILFLNTIIVFELLAQMATYFVDITHTAFVVASLFYLFRFIKEAKQKDAYVSSLIMGLALLGKMTTLIYVIPFVGILLYVIVIHRKWKVLIICILLTSLPAVGFAFRLWEMTGNPLFPFYNSIFKSPYFSYQNFRNGDFGPRNAFEIIFWPVVSIFNKGRLGELERYFYDLKLSLFFFVACNFGITAFRQPKITWEKLLSVFFFVSYYLWTAVFGYLRYAAILEIIGGVMLIYIWSNTARLKKVVNVFLYLLIAFFSVQNYKILKVNLDNEYAWRPPLIRNVNLHLTQLKNIFEDKLSISSGLMRQINESDAFINCAPATSGYYTLLKVYKPVIMSHDLVFQYGMTKEYENKARALLMNKTYNYAALLVGGENNPNMDQCLKTLKNGVIVTSSSPFIGNSREYFFVFGKQSFK